MVVARRAFLATAGLCVLSVACSRAEPSAPAAAQQGNFPFTLTTEQWRERLTPDQFAVLRNASTEMPYSSPLDDEHRAGTFSCAGCSQNLFDSATKFDSGTGWPSFYQPLANAVGEHVDNSYGTRTEVHCSNCGGHLGHVFTDGPEPTGLRYCMNGVAMNFIATQPQ